MAVRLETVDAVVLRTTRFGDSDLIANVFAEQAGRIGVMAKGARKAKSRLGARLDPFYVVRLGLRHGRGDLAFVQSVEVIESHEHLRVNYERQAVAAAALDLLGRLTVEHVANEPAYHLARRLLLLLDSASELDDHHRIVLLTAWQMKLLHVVGMAPMLAACVRCGNESDLAWFSPRDGGVVCVSCHETGDTRLDSEVYDAAIWLMRTPLTDIATALGDDLPSIKNTRQVASNLIAEICMHHAGVRPKVVAG